MGAACQPAMGKGGSKPKKHTITSSVDQQILKVLKRQKPVCVPPPIFLA